MTAKRRILYIRHRRKVKISDAFRLNQDEWYETLSILADVTIAHEDCDLDEACTKAKPDFILYESPLFYAAPLAIENPHAHPEIPRIAFLMQDPYCSIRVNFFRALDDLNIKWVLTHMTETALLQSPELKGRLFSISFLFDETVFHDYGLEKDIPVSVFGGYMLPEIYNWRFKTARALPDHFPTLIYTHPGYNDPVPLHKFPVSGKSYAQMLNRSHFSIADSTVFNCLVRKHLEIPASGAVLIAPQAPVLKPYGFRDMENCILGEGKDLFDKMAAVADDPGVYQKIRKAGHDLVHEKYSRSKWGGILDFYECLRTLKAGETVIQQGILGPYRAAPEQDITFPAIQGDNPSSEISTLLQTWLDVILGKKELKDEYLTPPNWLSHMGEPQILVGILALLRGDPSQAEKLFLTPQFIRQKQSGFTDYDPEEIAWLSFTASMSGNTDLLKTMQRESQNMPYLSLRRLQWLGKILKTNGDVSNPPADVLKRAAGDRLSIHWSGQLPIEEWLSLINRIFKANGMQPLFKH